MKVPARVLAISTLLVLAAASARADAQPSLQAGKQPARAPAEVHSPRLAFAAAVGATALAGIVISYGQRPQHADDDITLAGGVMLMVAPATAHLYLGELQHAAVTTGIRTGSVAAMALGLDMIWCGACDPEDGDLGGLLLIGGGATFIVTTVYDWFDATGAATRENQRLAATEPSVTPAVVAAAEGLVPGLALAGRF